MDKGGAALNPRAELYTEDNVQKRLSLWDFVAALKETGLETSGPVPYSAKDRQKFSSALICFWVRVLDYRPNFIGQTDNPMR